MSLRARVALATGLASLLIVVAGGTLLVAAFENGAERRVDSQLSDQWRDLSQISLTVARAQRPAAEQLLDLGLQAPLAVRIIDRGEVVLAIGAPTIADFSAAAPAGFSTVDVDGSRWRVLADTVALPARPTRVAEVQFASPLAPIDASVADLRTRVFRIGLLVVAASALVGWAVGAAALRPIGRLRARAGELAETSDLTLRVHETLGATEVDDLAADLNHMLQRLEDGDRERRRALDAARSFSAAAAHELRTPLTSMQANIDVLQRIDELGDADRRALISDLAAEQQRLRDVLEALRMLARGDVAGGDVFEGVDLGDLTEIAVAEARRRYPDVDFVATVPDAPTTIRGWSEGLRVMIDNLLLNAATHGRPAKGPARVEVTVAAGENGVSLAVADNGPGVPPAERMSVLERFRRGSTASGGGSGLGLALVLQQAELHGGAVAIGDGAGGGAEFKVELRTAA